MYEIEHESCSPKQIDNLANKFIWKIYYFVWADFVFIHNLSFLGRNKVELFDISKRVATYLEQQNMLTNILEYAFTIS